MDFVGLIFQALLIMVAVVAQGSMNKIILCILVGQVLNLSNTLILILLAQMKIQSDMVRADRCMKMLDVPQEKQIYNKK